MSAEFCSTLRLQRARAKLNNLPSFAIFLYSRLFQTFLSYSFFNLPATKMSISRFTSLAFMACLLGCTFAAETPEQARDHLSVGIMRKPDHCPRESKDGDHLTVRYNNTLIDQTPVLPTRWVWSYFLVLQIKQKNRKSHNNSMRYFLFCSNISAAIILLSFNCSFNFAFRSVSFKVMFHDYKMGIYYDWSS